MEPVTAGLIAAAPKLLGALFGALAPKPRQPLPMAPSLMGGERLQLGGEAPQQGPTAGQSILDAILSGGLGALGAYAQQPTADSGMLSPRQYAAQQALMSPGGVSLGKPLSSLEPKGLSFMGQTPSLGRGGQRFNPNHQDYLESQRIYGGY